MVQKFKDIAEIVNQNVVRLEKKIRTKKNKDIQSEHCYSTTSSTAGRLLT